MIGKLRSMLTSKKLYMFAVALLVVVAVYLTGRFVLKMLGNRSESFSAVSDDSDNLQVSQQTVDPSKAEYADPEMAFNSMLNNEGVPYGDLLPEGDPGNLLDKVNFLDAGHHAGVDTIGSTLKIASHDLRKPLPNPKKNVSPWMMSTVEPDPYRKALDPED